jgi:Co/Zn/Cd efflux system component
MASVRIDGVSSPRDPSAPSVEPRLLRRTVLVVALLNLSYFFVEFSVAVVAGSVSLLADSVDFLEDTAINLLIFVALGWSLARRATVGKLMALVLLVPAAIAGWKAVEGFANPVPPLVTPLVLASLGAIVVNGLSAVLLARVRHHGGSLSAAAFLSARNDVLINVAIIVMGVLTAVTRSGWPDLVLGVGIILIGLHAAWEVWETSEDERLAARALAGDEID